MEITNGADIKRDGNFKMLIYGKPGCGKTSTVNMLQGKTLLLDIDGTSQVLSGNPNVDVVAFEADDPHKFMLEFYGYAKAYDYNNVVIDNISYYQKLWLIEKGKKSKSNMPEWKDYAVFDNHITEVIQAFKELNSNLILTAWESTRKISDETGMQTYNQFFPDLREKAINAVMGTLPVVARIVNRTDPETGEVKRGAILQESLEVYAKNQLDDRKACKLEELFNFEPCN